MRGMRYGGVLVIAVVALAGVHGCADVWADEELATAERQLACSDSSLRGTYGVLRQGTRLSAPGGPTESVIATGVRRYDGQGAFTEVSTTKGSINLPVENDGSGVYAVNADCTVEGTFELRPGVTIEEKHVIVDRGRELLAIFTSPQSAQVTFLQKKIDPR